MARVAFPVSLHLQNKPFEQRQGEVDESVCVAIEDPLADQAPAVGVELVGVHPEELADLADPAGLCLGDAFYDETVLRGELCPDFFVNIFLEIPAELQPRPVVQAAILFCEISQHLEGEGISLRQLRHLPRRLRAHPEGGPVVVGDGAEVQGGELDLRGAVEKGQAFFVLEEVDVLVEARHQQEDRKVLPEQYLEGAGEDAHVFRVGHLIHGDENPSALFSEALKHFLQGQFDIGNGGDPADLQPNSKEGKVDLRLPEYAGQPVLTGQLGGQAHQHVAFRVQRRHDPLLVLPQPVSHIGHEHRLSGSSNACQYENLL